MEANQEINQENMETFVAVDDDGNRVPVQVVRSGDNLVIFLNEGQSIEGVTNALQGMADGSGGGQDQYQIMVTDNYQQGEGVQVEGVQAAEGFQQVLGDGTQVLQTMEDGSQVLQTVEDGSHVLQQAEDGSQILQTVPDGSQVLQTVEDGSQVLQQVEGGTQVQEVQPVIDMEPGQTFSTETYQQYQVDEMVQGVQGVQVQPVSETGEVMDAFVPAAAQAEGQEVTAVTTFIPTIEGAAEAEGVNSYVSVASGSESEGVSAFVSAVASGFQEPGGAGHAISNVPGVNIPIDSNFTQYDQTTVTYAPAEASAATTGVDEVHYEQASLASVGTTQITDQYGQTVVATAEGALQYAAVTEAQLGQQGVVTTEVPEGHLQIDLQRKPIEVVTDLGDLIVQQQHPTGTTAAIQTQIDKPFIATKVTNVAGSVIGQKITQQTITPARTPAGSKGQGVSILLKCEKCDQVFFTASDLKSHREKVHGATVGKIASVVESKLIGEGESISKNLSNLCNICHIICPTQTALIKHKHDKHGMDMPFKCETCNYSTTQKKYLDVHVKTHTKVHNCSVCSNKFESEEKLKKHMTTHSRDKYQCFYCSKMYLTRKACTDHIALKHSGPQKNVQFVETKKEIPPAPAAASTPGPGTGQSTAGAQTDYDTAGPGDTLLAGTVPDSSFGDNLLQDNLDQLANVAAAQANNQTPKTEEIDDGKTEEEKVSEALQALEEASATYKYTEESQSAADAISFPDDFPDDDAEPDDEAMETSGSQAADDGKSDLEKLAAGAVDIKPGPSTKPSPTKAPAGLEDYTPIKNKNFECLGCFSQFPTELLYQNHFLKEHCDENVCLLCGRDFAKRYLIRVHFHESHCNKDVYKCKNCDKMFNMVSKYWQHAQIHARRHVCRICDKAYSTATEMKRHETSVHYNKSYFCVYCPETFTSAATLRQHKEDAHNIKRHGNKKDKASSKSKVDGNKEIPGTIVAGSTGGGAKNLIEQAKERGTQMTIKIFRDGTYQTTDPNTGKTDSGTIDLSNLGLDPSLLQTHNDLELVIIPPDKDEDQKDSTASSENSSSVASTPKIGSSKGATPIIGKITDSESLVHKQVVNGDRTFSCSFCPRTFRFYRHLQCHENAHSQDEKYDCHICQRMFVREKNLKLHLELHKKQTIPASGKKKQTPPPKVQRHIKQHNGPFPCTYCSEIFTEKDVLNNHVKESHQIKVHTCPICGKELFSYGKLLSHLKIIHAEDKDIINDVVKKALTCDICDKKFASAKSVRRHRLLHDEKKYQCPHCPWKFYQSYKLKNHIKVHEQSGSKESSMEDEDGSPTKSEEMVPMDPIEKHKLRSNPQCPDCGKKFSTLGAVLSHMRYCKKGIKKPTSERKNATKQSSPTNVKTQPDEILSGSGVKHQKTFSKTESLKKHKLVHAVINKKPEKSKSKTRKPELKTDLLFRKKESVNKSSKLSVSQVRKYYDISLRKCVKCKMTFSSVASLKRHFSRRHPETGISMETKVVNGEFENAKTRRADSEPKTEEELKEIAKNNFLQMNFALGIKTEPRSELTSPVVETVKTKRHDCSLCGLKFSREATLKKHLVEVHNEEDFYQGPESDSSSDSDSMDTQPHPASPVKTRRMRESLTSTPNITPKIKTEPEEPAPRTSEKQRLRKGGKESTPKLDVSKGKIKVTPKIKTEPETPTPRNKEKLKLKKGGKESTPKLDTSKGKGRSTPKIKIEPEETTLGNNERRMSKKGGKESTPKLDISKGKIKKEVEVEPRPQSKTIPTRSALTVRKFPKQKDPKKKDIKKIVSSLSTVKALRNKKPSHNLRVKKKLASLQRAKSKKPTKLPEPDTRHRKRKQEEVSSKKGNSVKEMRQKVQSKAVRLRQSKPKHPIKPVVSNKARDHMKKSFNKSESRSALTERKSPKQRTPKMNETRNQIRKGGKSDTKKPVKKSGIIVSKLVKKTALTSKDSKEKRDIKSSKSSELDSGYRKIRLSTGIEKQKCEYCGRVSWTIGSYEEHLSKYHADRWIEKSVDSLGIVSSSMAVQGKSVDSAFKYDEKLSKRPVVMIQRLPVDLLVKSSENLVSKGKKSQDRYLGAPYNFSDEVKMESSETKKEAVIDLPLVELDSTEILPDLPLEPSAIKTDLPIDSEETELQKEDVEDYLKPDSGGKTSTDTIGFPECMPDEILASNVDTPIENFSSGEDSSLESGRAEKEESQTESVLDSLENQEESIVKEEEILTEMDSEGKEKREESIVKEEDLLTEMDSEGNTLEEKTESETKETALESSVTESELLGENNLDDGIEYQEMTEDVSAQLESETGTDVGLNETETTELQNGNNESYDMGIVESEFTSGIEETAVNEKVEYEEMQMEGVTSTELQPDDTGTNGQQDEHFGVYMEGPLEREAGTETGLNGKEMAEVENSNKDCYGMGIVESALAKSGIEETVTEEMEYEEMQMEGVTSTELQPDEIGTKELQDDNLVDYMEDPLQTMIEENGNV